MNRRTNLWTNLLFSPGRKDRYHRSFTSRNGVYSQHGCCSSHPKAQSRQYRRVCQLLSFSMESLHVAMSANQQLYWLQYGIWQLHAGMSWFVPDLRSIRGWTMNILSRLQRIMLLSGEPLFNHGSESSNNGPVFPKPPLSETFTKFLICI